MTPLVALALAAGQAVTPPAAHPPVPQNAPAAPAGDPLAPLVRAGLSPAGVAAIHRVDPTARAESQTLAVRGRALDAEIRAAGMAGDLDRLSRAMNERDALLAHFATARTQATLGLLRSMTPADRAIMMRALAGQMK